MALDFSKPYGTSIERGSKHKYIQDGKHFDVDGNEVTRDGKPVVTAKAPVAQKVAPVAEVQAVGKMDSQAAAQLKV